MFVVFSGKGWVAPVSTLAAVLLAIMVDPAPPWVFWVLIPAFGIIDYRLGKRLNSAPPRLLKDLQTGEIIEEYPDHSFFWIPLQYWLWIKVFFAFSAIVAFLSDRYDL